MKKYEAELVIDAKAALGEGPCWHPGEKLLYWVDIVDQKVNVFNPVTNETSAIQVGQDIGAAVPRESGGLVLAAQHGFFFLEQNTGKLTPIHDPEKELPNNRFNDGKCDHAGRFWAGTLCYNGELNQGSLYCLDTDLSVSLKVSQVSISNGLAWTSDSRTMYYVDSPTKKVVAYDYDVVTAQISNPRTVITIPEGEGVPDGMTIDAEGNLWVAQWGGWQVSGWNPNTGEKFASIQLPASQVTSCAFGGENLDVLYITTANVGIDSEEPLAGGLFKAHVNARGLPENLFRG